MQPNDNKQSNNKLIEKEKEKLKPQPIKNSWKYGVNKPCPCNSGKKFKKCCWPKIKRGEINVT